MEPTRLMSHVVSPEKLECIVQRINHRITQEGDKPYATVAYQLELVAGLCQFDLGRYLLQNQGVNGFWTDYVLTWPWLGRKTEKNNTLTKVENFLLNQAPTFLATQQRFEIFLQENQQQVKENAKLASLPCGLMGELLYLDYQGVEQIDLIGIDYDPDTLNKAQNLAAKKGLTKFVKALQKDAWCLGAQDEFDLISSNGLNIYEPDHEKVTALYRQFYQALKPGGKLVISTLTPPPSSNTSCEWDLAKINHEDLLMQKIIFSDILAAKWQCYRSTEQTHAQLRSVGFENIQTLYDDARMFPALTAFK